MTLWAEDFDPAEPELKKRVLERLVAARKNGLTAGAVEKASNREINAHNMFDMMDAKVLPKRLWEKMDEVLDKLGY